VASQRSSKNSDVPAGERVEFASRRGAMLVGDLYRCGEGAPALLLCHGMESTRGGTKQTAMVSRLVPQGYTVLTFDFSYVGESEGDFADMTLSGEVSDALGAVDFIKEFAPSSCVLVGSSFGGAVALLAAAQLGESIDAVATIAAVADTALFTRGLSPRHIAEWRANGRRRWHGGQMNVGFLEDVENIDILAAVATLDCPLLLLHGLADEVVPPEHASAIAAAAQGEVKLEMVPGVGHRFEEPGALQTLLSSLESWLARTCGGEA